MAMPRIARSGCRLALAIVLSVPVPAWGAEPLGVLLDRLAPAKAPQGTVEVVSWIERSGARPELVVTFVPKGRAKLVADPGVSITPVPRPGVTWASETPVSATVPGQDYFAAPPTVRVAFVGEDGQPVEAAVEYAYCLVDHQCLFGEARVSAATQPQG